MTLTSKNSCLPALFLPVPVNLFLDFLFFFLFFSNNYLPKGLDVTFGHV